MHRNSDTSVRLKGVTKSKLDKLCKEYQYITLNECVYDMVSFFIENGLSPTSNLNVNLAGNLEKINKDFIKRDDSFRKWFGDLYYKKIAQVIQQSTEIYEQNQTIFKLLDKEFKQEILVEIKETQDKESSDSTESSLDKIKDKDTWKSSFFSVLKQREDELLLEQKRNEKLKNTLEGLLSKAQKKSVFNSTLVIELTKEEVDSLHAFK